MESDHAIAYLTRAILTGENLSQISETSRALETLRGQIAGDRGIGEPIVTAFLRGALVIAQRGEVWRFEGG